MKAGNEIPRFPLIINGELCEPLSGDYLDVANPASGEVIARAAMGDSTDLDKAVGAARSAFEDARWRKMSPDERSIVLYQCAQLIMANVQELAGLEVSASGGTISRVTGLDIPAMVDLFMVLAEEVKEYPFVESLPPRILPEMCHTQVLKQPIGVCGLITAWNFPLLLFGLKVAPAFVGITFCHHRSSWD